MNRHIKLITALLSIIFCFSLLTFTVSAVDADGDGYDDGTGEYIGVPSGPLDDPVEPVEPVVTDPIVTDPIYIEPETEAPYYEPETDPYYYDDSNNDYDSSYDQDSDDFYVGGGQTYVPPVSTAPSAALYDAEREIDVNELSSNDWDDIKANLSNANSADGDADDFSFIKDNDSTADNGEWMLITGIVCLLLSVAGIIYIIVSTVSRRKKISAGTHSVRRPAYASGGAYSHSADVYDDDYGTSSKNEKKKLERSRKYDTAEVRLPKSGTRYKNGGRRYK